MTDDIRSIAATFDERAKDYRKNEWHRHYAQRLVELAGLEPGDRVLDAGAGTGFAAVAVALRIGPHGHVLGADVSAGMLREARTAIEAAGISNIELLQADATDLNEHPSSTFDTVICAAALLYMPVSKALSEWHRLLKPDGAVAFSTMRAGSPQAGQLFRECAATFGIILEDPSEELGSESRCQIALETAGFRHIKVIQEQIELSAPDLELAWESNFRSAAHSAVRELSHADQDVLRQQYALALARAQMLDRDAISRAGVLYAFGRK